MHNCKPFHAQVCLNSTKSGRSSIRIPSLFVPAVLGCVLFVASGSSGHAQTYSLEELVNGATFTIPTNTGHSVIFENFANTFAIPPHRLQPGQLIPSASEMFATAINVGTANPGLLWQSAAWAVTPTQFLDAGWTYDVVTTDSINGTGMALGSYFSQPGGDILVKNALANDDENLGNLLNSPCSTPAVTHDDLLFDPTSVMHAATDVSVQANTDGNAALFSFTQTFSSIPAETPEPNAPAMVLGMGIAAGLLSRRRLRRRKR
ncbi:MAG: hypothetical protein JWN14_3054 [Chthonomonadales bacterium]|nr:hypothetical protein [Chthonomonadales bacterium]